jgi:TolB-like protein
MIVAMSGDDSPGIRIGLIMDPAVLGERVVQSLILSLSRYLSGEGEESNPGKKRYGPKVSYRSDSLPLESKYRIAVVPFLNLSDRKYAGEIMVLHFLTELVRDGGFEVVESGVLRHRLLNVRVIMDEGITLRDADLISLTLKADLVLTGKVIDYQDFSGATSIPKIDFSAIVIEQASKKVVWSSMSYNHGDDGVFFFDRGKINTAGRLARYMVGEIVEKLSRGEEVGTEKGGFLPYSPKATE